jgi:hypothetical protein
LGNPLYILYFIATYYMHFPFLISKVKCGTIRLKIIDWQNAHSMKFIIKGIIKLFKLAKRENKLYREILTFLISYNHQIVWLYGYYPIINGIEFITYCHLIHTFNILPLGSKERWMIYNFTVKAYIESLTLLKKIRSIINKLPFNFNFKHS